jgi:hypothetical protein
LDTDQGEGEKYGRTKGHPTNDETIGTKNRLMRIFLAMITPLCVSTGAFCCEGISVERQNTFSAELEVFARSGSAAKSDFNEFDVFELKKIIKGLLIDSINGREAVIVYKMG